MAESHQQLRQINQLILQSAGEGIYGLDAEGMTTFVNQAAATMLGWSVDELIGQPMHALLHHSYADGSAYPREACPIYAAFKDGVTHEVRNEVFWRKDGSSFPVDYTSTPINKAGQLIGAVVVFRDMTERKKAEDALRISEARFRKLFDNSSDGIVLFDADNGDIIKANPSFCNMLGYSLEELQAMNSMDIHRHELNRFKGFTESVIEHSSGRTDELSCLAKQGKAIPAEITASTFIDSNEGRYLIMAAVRDISERKQAEELIRQAQIKIAVAHNEMKIARQIQDSLLPSAPLKHSGVEITGLCQPAAQVGGDYFDYFFRDEDHIDVVIADVSGHSVSSGLFMVETRSVLRAQAHALQTPANTLSSMNQSLYEDLSQADHFITMFYTQYNAATRRLIYANAGKCPPMLLRNRGAQFEQLDADGLVLGVRKEVDFEEKTLVLNEGDMLFLYTDGVIEAENPDGEFFGTKRLSELLSSLVQLQPQELISRTVETLQAFCQQQNFNDDLTIVIIKVA